VLHRYALSALAALKVVLVTRHQVAVLLVRVVPAVVVSVAHKPSTDAARRMSALYLVLRALLWRCGRTVAVLFIRSIQAVVASVATPSQRDAASAVALELIVSTHALDFVRSISAVVVSVAAKRSRNTSSVVTLKLIFSAGRAYWSVAVLFI
jgi:hypothetical protein